LDWIGFVTHITSGGGRAKGRQQQSLSCRRRKSNAVVCIVCVRQMHTTHTTLMAAIKTQLSLINCCHQRPFGC